MALLSFVALSLLAGVSAAAIIATSAAGWYDSLPRPAGSPPGWLAVWLGLVAYSTAGFAAWRAHLRIDRAVARTQRAMRRWGWQLLVNALGVPCFFVLHSPALATVFAVGLIAMTIATASAFRRLDRWAPVLLLPSLAWSAFAAYLTIGFWWLNGP